MSTDTTDPDVETDVSDESEQESDEPRWIVENDSGISVARTGYSDYEFATNRITVEFESVRETDDGAYKLLDGHRTQATVHVTDTVAAVLDVLQHEL